MNSLPNELLDLIFSFSNSSELVNFTCVSKNFHQVIHDENIWRNRKDLKVKEKVHILCYLAYFNSWNKVLISSISDIVRDNIGIPKGDFNYLTKSLILILDYYNLATMPTMKDFWFNQLIQVVEFWKEREINTIVDQYDLLDELIFKIFNTLNLSSTEGRVNRQLHRIIDKIILFVNDNKVKYIDKILPWLIKSIKFESQNNNNKYLFTVFDRLFVNNEYDINHYLDFDILKFVIDNLSFYSEIKTLFMVWHIVKLKEWPISITESVRTLLSKTIRICCRSNREFSLHLKNIFSDDRIAFTLKDKSEVYFKDIIIKNKEFNDVDIDIVFIIHLLTPLWENVSEQHDFFLSLLLNHVDIKDCLINQYINNINFRNLIYDLVSNNSKACLLLFLTIIPKILEILEILTNSFNLFTPESYLEKIIEMGSQILTLINENINFPFLVGCTKQEVTNFKRNHLISVLGIIDDIRILKSKNLDIMSEFLDNLLVCLMCGLPEFID